MTDKVSSDKISEMTLLALRPDAPLVRSSRLYDGIPPGTLGYIAGVKGSFIRVVFAGADKIVEALLMPHEVDNV